MLLSKELSWSLEDASASARIGDAGVFCSLNFIIITPLGVEYMVVGSFNSVVSRLEET